jgi:tRNA G18 (ribose-2'-O)-methylase SpoU
MPEMLAADDPRLAAYRAVGDPTALERDGLFVAEGRLVVERLLEDGRYAVHSVAATAAAIDALAPVLARRADVTVYACEPATLREVTGFHFHRGCLALAHRPRHHTTVEMLAPAVRILALEGVADPDNVGGLFRTALALGIDAVVINEATADPLYRKAIRTSMAATLRLPFVRVGDWLETLTSLRTHGFRIVALTPHPDAITLEEYAATIDDRIVIVVGSEGFGMTGASLAHADVRVRIPVDPRADSLNVVNAAAIALYALRPAVT